MAMDVDLDQLPIPDWGLHCPNCRYPLFGLPSHRCPECGLEFEMSDVVKTWCRLRDPRFTGHELPFPDCGLKCRHCDHPLVGATTRACPSCGWRFDPEEMQPRRSWFVVDQEMCGIVPIVGLEVLFAAQHVPYTRAAGKLLTEIYGGSSVIGVRLLVPREFYFEACWLIRQAGTTIRHSRQSPNDEWTCSNCGEQVPGSFDICWKCEVPREQQSAAIIE